MEDFFFTGPLDYLLYEAELAQGSRKPITLDIRRRPVETPGETTWTGFGFKQVFEGSDITFRIPSIYRLAPKYVLKDRNFLHLCIKRFVTAILWIERFVMVHIFFPQDHELLPHDPLRA